MRHNILLFHRTGSVPNEMQQSREANTPMCCDSATVYDASGLIVAAGVLYSIGVVFHLWDSLRFQNAIWHGFALSAAALQFLAVFDLISGAAAATR